MSRPLDASLALPALVITHLAMMNRASADELTIPNTFSGGTPAYAATISATAGTVNFGTGGGGGGIVILASATSLNNAAGVIDVHGGNVSEATNGVPAAGFAGYQLTIQGNPAFMLN